MNRLAFISPFTNTTNRYIELQKKILLDCGFEVRPLSLKAILSGQAIGIMSPRNLMLFHWLETRPFQLNGANHVISIKGLVEFCIYALLMAVSRAKVVYFVHNHGVHDTTGFKKSLSMKMINMLRALADVRVVHDPSYCEKYKANYLPHPLYWDDWDTSETQAPPRQPDNTQKFSFGMLGAVRPYKDIHTILHDWPHDLTLTIRGRATSVYEAEIRRIIKTKQLEHVVDFQPRFLSESEFLESLTAIEALILGHVEKSMLVSGAFFEAIGRVPMIFARTSPFTVWASQKFPAIRLFETHQELLLKLRQVHHADQTSSQAHQLAIDLFGRSACKRLYSEVLR
jgi:beta-1,4-mannosyltransferase